MSIMTTNHERRKTVNNQQLPPTWSLEAKDDDELLFIARNRLIKATRRAEWKITLLRLFGRDTRDLKRVFYADWYALSAINELINRKGRS